MSATGTSEGASRWQHASTSGRPCAAARRGARADMISQPATDRGTYSLSATMCARGCLPEDISRESAEGSADEVSVSIIAYSGYTI